MEKTKNIILIVLMLIIIGSIGHMEYQQQKESTEMEQFNAKMIQIDIARCNGELDEYGYNQIYQIIESAQRAGKLKEINPQSLIKEYAAINESD